jgi:hypothetical protein
VTATVEVLPDHEDVDGGHMCEYAAVKSRARSWPFILPRVGASAGRRMMAGSVLRTVGVAVTLHAVWPQERAGEAKTPSSALPSEHSVQRCRVVVYVCAGISATVVRACRKKGRTEGNDESQRAKRE